MQDTYDHVIVGARCAGAAAGLLLARAGARVLIVDAGRIGEDTLSTHALMRGAVVQLARWGVLPQIVAAGTPPVRATRFVYDREAVDVDIRPGGGIDALYAPRRTVLDPALAEAAGAAGAELRFETTVTDLVWRGGRVTGLVLRDPTGRERTVQVGHVIGADGLRSRVARRVGARTIREGRHAAATVYARFARTPAPDYRWYYAPHTAGGLIPTNAGETCAFLSMPPARLKHAARWTAASFAAFATAHLPALADDLGAACMTSPVFVFRGMRGYVREAIGPGWALVGDAGYFRDPITANGITDALRDAELLARALMAGRLADYPEARDAMSRAHFEVTDRIAALDWRMEEIAALHRELNAAAKPTLAWIAGLDRPDAA